MAPTTVVVPVGSLTDAELAVLARPRTRVGPRPVMPVWARLHPRRREAAAREARASLVARGLVDPDSRGRADVRRDLRSVVVLRETATTVVAVARATAHGRDHWYAHVTGDVVLVEQVATDGVHRFALTAAATLPTLVAAAVLHPDAAVASDPTPDGQTEWLRADVEVRGAGPVDRMAWVSGPGGTWRLDAEQAVPPDDVRRHLIGVLAGILPGDDDGR